MNAQSTFSPQLPPELERVRNECLRALGQVKQAGLPEGAVESRGLILSSRTRASRELPAYYLIYFLLVDLLQYPHLGRLEKVAWVVPIRFEGRLYSIEHRKMGIGIFSPNLDPLATRSVTPTEQAERDSEAIARAIKLAVGMAQPYFGWRAAQAASTSDLNVTNVSGPLFERYVYFRDEHHRLTAQVETFKNRPAEKKADWTAGDTSDFGEVMRAYENHRKSKWNAQAAIEAFFSWTEHVFIQLAILQGKLSLGSEVAELANADWKAKFKAALDLSDMETKQHYDVLLDLRAQIRNFMAHGAFGKRGEAFHFHSGAGAVPVLLSRGGQYGYSLAGDPSFDEKGAIEQIEAFVAHLWTGSREAAKPYIFSSLPTILSFVVNGKYAEAMTSKHDMSQLVGWLTRESDQAANMDY